MPQTTTALQDDLNAALQKGWQAFPHDPQYELTKDYFFELAHSSFFEQRFRGKIPNPAHDHAIKTMSKYVNAVLATYALTLEDFYPGDFKTSTGEEITSDPVTPLYEHRSFHNKAWKDGKPFCSVVITICHIRGKFEFPKTPFVTIKEL